MSFPARLLNDGEEVVLDVRPYWWYLAGPVAVSVAVLAGAIVAVAESAPRALGWVVVVALVLSLVWLVVRYVRWATTSLVVTTDRLIHRRGVVAKQGREIPLVQLTNISYRQSIAGRLIGSGELVLESAGRDSQETFPDLPHPAAIQNVIYRQIERARDRGAGSRPLSIPEQIEQLDELRRRGLLSEEEFDAKKAELLDRL
jgi:uncharacterized membrane protein YdbT with pleckstrin-like domain